MRAGDEGEGRERAMFFVGTLLDLLPGRDPRLQLLVPQVAPARMWRISNKKADIGLIMCSAAIVPAVHVGILATHTDAVPAISVSARLPCRARSLPFIFTPFLSDPQARAEFLLTLASSSGLSRRHPTPSLSARRFGQSCYSPSSRLVFRTLASSLSHRHPTLAACSFLSTRRFGQSFYSPSSRIVFWNSCVASLVAHSIVPSSDFSCHGRVLPSLPTRLLR